VYEDENLLLLDKKAGVLCHSDGGYDYSTLIARAQAYLYQKREWDPRAENSFAPALCNRIDRNTSGIVIAAKTAEALRIVNEKIQAREIDKLYLAAVVGSPPEKSGKLEGWIFKDASKNRVYVYDGARPGAQYAATEYRAICSRGGLTLLECRLLTGRTHQIRAQLAAAGCAILGDGKYGSERINREYGEKRQLLCSYKLIFSFKTDAGALEYLKGREFKLERVDFRDKYFG
jgi:23S rRNA pseudouridine955/2504/2580 synthase